MSIEPETPLRGSGLEGAMSPLASALPAVLAFALLAACSQNDEGRKAIADRCVADGGTDEVCKCLADESAKRLDQDMFDIVVLGAQGDDKETEIQIGELAKDRQIIFSAKVEGVRRGCGVDEATPAS